MANIELKSEISKAIKQFSTGTLVDNGINLFRTLGYETDRQSHLDNSDYQTFAENYIQDRFNFNSEKALTKDWSFVDIMFQLSKEEVLKRTSLFDTKKVDNTIIEAYLFICVELKKELYSRTELSQITREINKLFPMPVMILFKYGNVITLSVINRRIHKREATKDVLEKVTLIKDINFLKPNRAHIEILHDLAFDTLNDKFNFTNFVELHNAWKKTLDTKELNAKFYNDLFNWYLWASKYVEFPQIRPKEDLINNDLHQSESLIRLLTRLLFCWFMKEKGLIQNYLFEEDFLNNSLKEFSKNNRESSIFYKAILQNLFFATLNKPIEDRKIISNNFPNPSYGDPLVYRYKEYFKDEKKILEYFSGIPFLNGGLFDCLDSKKTQNSPEIRLDGFSSSTSKQPIVPDKLFFGEYKNIDLSADFDNDSKKKKITVFGLIDILSNYKFTIEENTPLEEEIALDPELLGKVFENLLASYIPETKATARKTTGSYYTPREIVNYMVDESIIKYLTLKVGTSYNDIATEDRIRILTSNSEIMPDTPFSKIEKKKILSALNECKILDPACGSGAFPMGMLHKMIHILRKIDPENKDWFEMVISNFPSYMQNEMRNKLKDEDWNYIRKLGIIKECIYGVDKQAIAIQIAKLRFFISLLVDQKEKPNKPNRGYEALPNLDFKLVAANTLIFSPDDDSITQGLFIDSKDEFAEKFEELSSEYFTTYKPEEKIKIKNQINELITEKCKYKTRQIESKTDGFDERSKKSLLEKHKKFIAQKEQELFLWNSYKNLFKSETVEFFDTKYFFPKITNGFDIVIGNPPYIRADSPLIADLRKQILDSGLYKTLWEKWDIYVAFIERGFQLLKEGGLLEFIIPDAYISSKYAEKSHDYFVEESLISRINFCSEVKIFDAAVKNIIIEFQKLKDNNHKPKRLRHVDSFENFSVLSTNLQSTLGDRCFKIESEENILSSPDNCLEWGDICYVSYGLRPSSDERFWKGEFTKDDLISDNKDRIHPKAYIEGKWIKKYYVEQIKYLEWDTERSPSKLVRPTFPELYVHPKIMFGGMTGSIYDNNGLLSNHSITNSVLWKDLKMVSNLSINNSIRKDFGIKGDKSELSRFRKNLENNSEKFNLKYMLAILNSSYGFYFLNSVRRSQIGFYPDDLKKLPIKEISNETQLIFSTIVDYIMFSKKSISQNSADYFERLIDAMVYELYFPDEIKAANAEVLKHLTNLPELEDKLNEEEKLAIIDKVYKELSDPKHPISQAMFRMEAVEEIRIIEGKKE